MQRSLSAVHLLWIFRFLGRLARQFCWCVRLVMVARPTFSAWRSQYNYNCHRNISSRSGSVENCREARSSVSWETSSSCVVLFLFILWLLLFLANFGSPLSWFPYIVKFFSPIFSDSRLWFWSCWWCWVVLIAGIVVVIVCYCYLLLRWAVWKMSEFNRNQRPSNNSASRNPLLSASVMGLTFDEFANRPQLLPAAPTPPSANANTSGLATSTIGSDARVAVFTSSPSFLTGRAGGKFPSLFITIRE